MRRRSVILAAALAMVFLVMAILAPATLAQRMDVPAWKQADPRWAGMHLGGSSHTMSRSGCAVTAAAMVAAYFGSDKSPGELCRALNANKGLTTAGDLYWQRIPAAAGGSIRYVARFNYCSLSRINQELDAGYPVIAKVHRKGNTHFVVITGRSGSTYYINDPAGGLQTTLNEQYGNPRAVIHGFRVYRGTQPSSAAAGSSTRYQQADASLVYRGVWKVSSGASASGGTFRFADSAGASLTITFKGTYLAWIAKKSPLYGRAKVTVDGGKPVTVDLYSAHTLWQKKAWDTGRLAAGTHTVRIQWTGKKNPAADDTNIGVDAFEVRGRLVAARG